MIDVPVVFDMTLFETTRYYYVMAVTGWFLVAGYIVGILWLYKNLRGNRDV